MIWLNGTKLNFTQFPNNETKMDEVEIKFNVYYQGSQYINKIKFQYETDIDLIELMFVKKYLDTMASRSELLITYMPYSRMDRSENGSAFTLKYVCEFINSLKFDRVTVIEPHSDVTPALLNNCESRFVSVDIFKNVVNEIEFNIERDYVYFSDASSQKRYSNKIGNGYKELVGMKKRDFTTRKIVRLDVFGDIHTRYFDVIMVDDIIGTGETCLLGAEQLRSLGANKIYVVAVHCENTIYDGQILRSSAIKNIYTTNSILTRFDSDKIVVRKI